MYCWKTMETQTPIDRRKAPTSMLMTTRRWMMMLLVMERPAVVENPPFQLVVDCHALPGPVSVRVESLFLSAATLPPTHRRQIHPPLPSPLSPVTAGAGETAAMLPT